VSEGSAENIFLIRGGVIYTPDPSANILEGITRRTIIHLARHELGLTVVERSIDRSELYCAEEVLLSGSAAGVQYVASIDRRPVGDGKPGPIGKQLSDLYNAITRGELPKYAGWLIKTYASRTVRA
jgi:branched-chain amino acid aminotransferase